MASENAHPAHSKNLNGWPASPTPSLSRNRGDVRNSEFDSGWSHHTGIASPPRALRSGWRLRMLVACALLGFFGVGELIRAVALAPHLDARWRATSQGGIQLAASGNEALRSHIGQTLTGITAGGSTTMAPDALALHRSPRWVVNDVQRARQITMHDQMSAALAHNAVWLSFADGSKVELHPYSRGLVRLPPMFWLLSILSLALYLVAIVQVLAHPRGRSWVYAIMALSQAGNLLLIAVESTREIGLPTPFAHWDAPVRMALDLFTAAAVLNAACLQPGRLAGTGGIALIGWTAALALAGVSAAGELADAWWWTQGAVIGLGLVAIGLLTWSYRTRPHPFAIMLRRLGVITAATWLLLTAAIAASDPLPGAPGNIVDIADIGPLVWYVFLGSLLLVPFLGKLQHFMREFSLLAAISTVAISLDLLFISAFSLGQSASLTLSLFLSLAAYLGVRQWILNPLLGCGTLSTEQMFEQLHRIVREVEAQPERALALLSQLLCEVFEPLEVSVVERSTTKTRMAGDGSSMLVPAPLLGGETQPHGSVLLRLAQGGRRLFTAEDARLTDRIVEQLGRAVHFGKAVEQGRREERLRLAQDLHDDIGARLLTLMYKAQSPEIEDYVRHTLQDLKTLTRGLAAQDHRLSHAVAEWKSDLTHRLTAARVELKSTFFYDEDIVLTVVHWSALTRILRELVSNAIAHSMAQQLSIDFRLQSDRVELTVTDNGMGRAPRDWSHGLGLGGVRKRVKQLGGEVEWQEVESGGICCRVMIRDLSARR